MFSTAMICAMAYIFGVLSSSILSLSSLAFFTICFLIFCLINWIFTRKTSRALPIFALLVLLGGIRYSQADQNIIYTKFPEKYVTVTGTIYSNPSPSSGNYKYRYILKSDTISYLENTYASNFKLIMNTKEKLDFGDKVTASGFLNEIATIENEYEYDFAGYYKSLGIHARMTAFELQKNGEAFSCSPLFLAGKIRSVVFENIEKHFSGDNAAYLKTIILGDKSYLSDDTELLLRKSGVLHSLSSPFIHISLITLLAGILFRKNKKHFNTAIFFMLLAYAMLGSNSPTIIKAAFLAIFLIVNKKLFGYSDKIEILSVVVLAMTILEPLLCFNSGFAMSVAGTYLVCISFGPIYTKLTPYFNKFSVPRGTPRQLITLWIIFTVGTLPLLAHYFNGLSLYSILATPVLIVLVLSVFALTPFLFILHIPGLMSVLDFILYIIRQIPRLISLLPFSYIMLPTPKLIHILIFYLAWWLLLRFLKGKQHLNSTKAIAIIMTAFILSAVSDISPNSMDIYFVNVGQGDGAVIKTGFGETILIDGGGSADYQTGYNIGERVYLPYLISHGFTNIDVAVLTHYHKDHAEGIIAAAENLKINTLVMPDTDPDNSYRRTLEEIAQRRNIKIEYLLKSDKIQFNSGLTLNIVAPDAKELLTGDENDTSLVIEAKYGSVTALFTGDSTLEADSDYPKDVDILKVSHHGSSNATSKAFAEFVSPDYAVISVGRGNTYNLPSQEVLKMFENAGSTILRTDRMGDIHFKAHKNGSVKYRTLR